MSDAQSLTLSLRGKWYGNHGSAPCPVCQPERRKDQHGLSVKAEGGRLLIWCHKSGCDFRAILDAAGIARDGSNLAAALDPQADAQRATYDAAKREQPNSGWGVMVGRGFGPLQSWGLLPSIRNKQFSPCRP